MLLVLILVMVSGIAFTLAPPKRFRILERLCVCVCLYVNTTLRGDPPREQLRSRLEIESIGKVMRIDKLD